VYPPDDTKPNAQTITISVGYIYYNYQDINGTPRTLVYDIEGKGWSVDSYSPAVNCHLWQMGQVNQTLCGCVDGTIRAMANGGGEASTSIVMTRSENSGDSRALKRIGDVFLKALATNSNPFSIALWKSRLTVPLSGFSPTSLTGTGSLQSYIVDFTSGFGNDVDDIALEASWPVGSGNQLDLWQPDWTDLPEIIQDRPTDWDDAGTADNKFVQGMMVELDTFGVPKTFSVERSDDGALFTPNECPVTVNGQTLKAFTFTPPFQAHMMRIVSKDGVPWRLWGEKWITKSYPESVSDWESEMLSFGLKGWLHIPWINLAYAATAPVTLTLTFNTGGVITLTFPSTGGKQDKVFQTLPDSSSVGSCKFKLVSFKVSSSSPFNIFQPDCEVAIKEWGSTGPYQIIRPFGGQNQPGAEL
jgi:hypothetical protein